MIESSSEIGEVKTFACGKLAPKISWAPLSRNIPAIAPFLLLITNKFVFLSLDIGNNILGLSAT